MLRKYSHILENFQGGNLKNMKKMKNKITSLFGDRNRYPGSMVEAAHKAVKQPERYAFFGSEKDPKTGCYRFVTAEEVAGGRRKP